MMVLCCGAVCTPYELYVSDEAGLDQLQVQFRFGLADWQTARRGPVSLV